MLGMNGLDVRDGGGYDSAVGRIDDPEWEVVPPRTPVASKVLPGSGQDGLKDITGTFRLTIEDDGTHRYELEYEL